MQEVDRAGILYYARERQYEHVYADVLELTRRHGTQPELTFWKAYSLVMEGKESEGMREVETIQDSRDLSLAAKMLLIHAHKMCKIVDREAVQMLEEGIRAERGSSKERALYHAALFLWLVGRSDKAREYSDRLLKVVPGSEVGLVLKGWIDLTSERDAIMKKSIKFFEEAASNHSQQSPGTPIPVDLVLGKARYYYLRHNFSHALELAGQAIAAHPRFLPALVEKMRAHLALQDCEQAMETAQRCLSQDVSCVEAHRVLVLELLARKGDYREAIAALGDLMAQLDQFEPHNHWLYHQTALSPARLAGGNVQVLQQTSALVEKALSLHPQSSHYLNELAYQQLLCGRVEDSHSTYKKAFSADETSIEALAGIIHCQLLRGQIDEAEQQLEFLAEVQSSIGKHPNLLYLNVLLKQQKSQPESEVLPLIHEARDLHIRGLKGQPLSCRYFELYNPQFLLWLAQCLVVYAPTEPAVTAAQAHPTLSQAANILESVLTAAPALTPALLLLARVRYLSGEMQASQSCLQRCVKLDSTSIDAHLLMAQLHLHLDNPQQSQSSLEMALSQSFSVKTNPLFHLTSGRVHRALGHTEDALSSLHTALQLSRQERRGVARAGLGAEFGRSELATVYLELVAVFTKLGQQHEAAKMMQDAIHEFSGTSQEFRISIANADLALERGDIDQALSQLKTISEDRPYYLQAKKKMADVYLHHCKDRSLYVACYRELAEKIATPTTALLLGDALMNIQEPEEALSVFERALKRNPRDSVLTSKVGEALVKTHQYTKAISYYEAALKSEGMQDLRVDLAQLYMRLNQCERAEKTIHTALSHRDGSGDVKVLCGEVELLLLLARVRERSGREGEAMAALEQARETQAKVLKKVNMESSDSLPQHRQRAAEIASLLAKANTDRKDSVAALQYYREALLHCDTDSRARLSLARALLSSSEVDQSEVECGTVLRADPNHTEATLFMGDLMFGKGEYEKALEHYKNLLSRTPDHFPALAQLVEVGRRSGKLSSAVQYVEQASSVCSHPATNPGLHYCRGLIAWYQGSTAEALHQLNHARRDSVWGLRALTHMVHICLNPNDDVIGGEVFRGTTEKEGSSRQDEQLAAIPTAQKLLKDAQPKSAEEEVEVRLLEGWVWLATRSKGDTEQALSRFMEMATSLNESVSPLVGVATAHMILRQTPRARNQLKRIAKTTWNSQEGVWFEKGWLLLADVYIQTAKYDMAIELLRKCLKYNQACCRAWEYMGFISEKEQAYKDAASHYEKAWQHSHLSNPAIGYRLAFNYLKAKRLVEAVDVCRAVLRKYPQYPRIQREILDKARQSIRV